MRFYYELHSDKYRIYDDETDKFETVDRLQFDKNIYYCFKGYDNDDKVRLFVKEFKQWCQELKTVTKGKIDYLKFNTHRGANYLIPQNYCPRLSEFGPIDLIESSWIEKCNTAGIQKLYQNGKHQCYGYDFKAFYLTLLGKKEIGLDIPMRAGKEYVLSEINQNKLQVGMYHVNIQCDNPKFVFAYSSNNVYTHTSLYYAMKMQAIYDIKIELVQNGEPNAYLYDKNDVHNSSYYFKPLYDALMNAKTVYPKNKLIKHICSSIWGHLCSFQIINRSIEDIIKEELNCTPDKNNKTADYFIKSIETDYYSLVGIKKPYKHNVARMKPFLLAKGQIVTSNVCMLYVDDLVRVHTDGIVFSKEHNDIMTHYKCYPTLLPEEKSTGLIDWQTQNTYFNFTTNEAHGKYKAKNNT